MTPNDRVAEYFGWGADDLEIERGTDLAQAATDGDGGPPAGTAQAADVDKKPPVPPAQ